MWQSLRRSVLLLREIEIVMYIVVLDILFAEHSPIPHFDENFFVLFQIVLGTFKFVRYPELGKETYEALTGMTIRSRKLNNDAKRKFIFILKVLRN
jgi:hypothetical protein